MVAKHNPRQGMKREEIARCAERQDSYAWQLRLEGYSLKEIAEALGSSQGVAASRIRRYRRRHGLGVDQAPPVRIGQRYPLTKAQGAAALELWRNGKSASSLAREYGVAFQTLAKLYRAPTSIKVWALEGDHFEEACSAGGHIDDAGHSGGCQRTGQQRRRRAGTGATLAGRPERHDLRTC